MCLSLVVTLAFPGYKPGPCCVKEVVSGNPFAVNGQSAVPYAWIICVCAFWDPSWLACLVRLQNDNHFTTTRPAGFDGGDGGYGDDGDDGADDGGADDGGLDGPDGGDDGGLDGPDGGDDGGLDGPDGGDDGGLDGPDGGGGLDGPDGGADGGLDGPDGPDGGAGPWYWLRIIYIYIYLCTYIYIHTYMYINVEIAHDVCKRCNVFSTLILRGQTFGFRLQSRPREPCESWHGRKTWPRLAIQSLRRLYVVACRNSSRGNQ